MLLFTDVLALTAALALTLSDLRQLPLKLGWVGVAALIVLILGATSSGLYDRDDSLPPKTTLDEAPKIFQLATLSVLIAWLVAGLVEHETLDPRHVLELWLTLSCLLVLGRMAARLLDLCVSSPERWLFIGDEATEHAFRSKLSNYTGSRATVAARIDLDEFADWRPDGDFMTAVAELRHLTLALGVHRTVIASPRIDVAQALNLVCTFQAAGVKVSVLPGPLEALGPSIEFDDLDGMTIMGIRRSTLNVSSTVAKRALDLTGALVGLLFASPLMLAIAIAIKLDTRGPIFFRQLRVGRRGLHFPMLKFRTMVRDAESLKDSLADRNQALTGLFKINGDPRITRVGWFLRKTSLDELPQLLNVLRGEMSLVGPRPLIPEEDCLMEEWQRRLRLDLLPGMTGPWQILGPVRVSLGDMANIDHRYRLDRSMWTDIAILLRTMPHIFARRGL